MALVLFGTYRYENLRYFTLSQQKYYVDKSCNIGICNTL